MIDISARQRSEVEGLDKIKLSMGGNSKISSYTHNLYKYPACFPETFPRSVIHSFSKEDSWILDPFSGGGTTAVECLASSRNFVGSDINDLAIFSSKLKTTILDNSDLKELDKWVLDLDLKKLIEHKVHEDQKFFANVPKSLEAFVRRMKTGIFQLGRSRSRTIATGVLLRLMQFELERSHDAYASKSLLQKYCDLLEHFVEQNIKLNFSIESSKLNFRPTVDLIRSDVTCPSVGLELEKYNRQFDLIVTSPPYPQRHILYNKWQVKGRSETRLPYWIIDSDQHLSESNYTMGARENKACLEIYLSSIFSCYHNLNPFVKKGALVFQVVTQPHC